MNLGDRIRALRKDKGLSQEEVARRAGMSLKNMGDIERGDVLDPHYSSLVGIAEGLGVDVVDLLLTDELPKAEAPTSSPEGEEKRRARKFMTQRPSDAERIWFIEKTIDILRHYYALGQRERSKMDEDEGLAWHGISYVWHGFYFEGLQPAMERDDVLLHASFVVHGPAEVSERERAACEKLLSYDTEMQNLIWDMRSVDDQNNARVRDDVSRGMAQVSEWLESARSGPR